MYPLVQTHVVTGNNNYTGVASNGTLTAARATATAGRHAVYDAGTLGGLFSGQVELGSTLMYVLFKQDAVASVTIKLVDESSAEYLLHTETTAPTAFVYTPNDPLFLPPGWKVKVESTGGSNANGRCTVHFDSGWGYTAGVLNHVTT
jgi:hypothetical protein